MPPKTSTKKAPVGSAGPKGVTTKKAPKTAGKKVVPKSTPKGGASLKKAAPKAGSKKFAKKGAPQKGGKNAGKKVHKKEWVKPLWQKVKAAHIEKRPRNFGIGGTIQPKRDLTRFVKWPRYIQIQRKRRILLSRFKVPPTINQFSRTLDKSSVALLFKLFNKYRPESKLEKKQRLTKAAAEKVKADEGKKEEFKLKKPDQIRFGLNEVTRLIEQKKAQLVIIAHDIDPLELVVWLPTLCRKKGIPYCIVKGKARLGKVVHRKTAAVCCFTRIHPSDKNDFATLVKVCTDSFNENPDIKKQFGGCKLGPKASARLAKRQKAIRIEEAKKHKASIL